MPFLLTEPSAPYQTRLLKKYMLSGVRLLRDPPFRLKPRMGLTLRPENIWGNLRLPRTQRIIVLVSLPRLVAQGEPVEARGVRELVAADRHVGELGGVEIDDPAAGVL